MQRLVQRVFAIIFFGHYVTKEAQDHGFGTSAADASAAMLDNDTRGWIMAVVSGIGMFVASMGAGDAD